MKNENISAFFHQAQTDENLQKALAELPNLPSSEGIQVLVKLSQTTPFPFTAEEFAAGVKAEALSDPELAGVTGGVKDGFTYVLTHWIKDGRKFFGLS